VEATKHLPVVVQKLRGGNVEQEEDGAHNPETGPPMIKGWRARKFFAMPNSVWLKCPRQIKQLAHEPPPVRAKKCKVCVRHKIGCHNLCHGTDLLHGWFNILCRFGSSVLCISIE